MRHVWLSWELFISRLDSSQCEDGRNPAGSLLIISLTWTYPKACGTGACREKFDVKVQLHIRSLHNKFSLSIKFINGRTIDISLVFCSFQPLPTGKPPPPVIEDPPELEDPPSLEDPTDDHNCRDY